MAFRRGFRAAPRRRTRNVVARRWSGDFTTAETTIAAATPSAYVVLATADYQQTASMESGGSTLVRIRGNYSLRGTVAGLVVYVAIYVIGDQESASDAATFAAYISGDTLYHNVHQIQAAGAPLHVDVDVKSKRKLENDVVVIAFSAVAQSVTFTYGLRCLVVGG